MAKFNWDHIHLRSPNPEATAAFYERMFGAEVVRTEQQGKVRIDLNIGGAKVFIAPVTPGDGVASPPKTPYQGLDHFGLEVKGIDAIVAELKAKGGYTNIPDSQTPWQEIFRANVEQLSEGMVLKPAVKYQKIAQSKGLPRDNH